MVSGIDGGVAGQARSGPRVTVAIPSYNQGPFLEEAIASVYEQDVAVEIFVIDGGSQDESSAVIRRWASCLDGWRIGEDGGQAEAVNLGIARGRAPYVCWLNSDDRLLPGALAALVDALEAAPRAPFAYAGVLDERGGRSSPARVEPFDRRRLARRCIIAQPGTLVRRGAWQAVGGLDESLHMAMDYDLWWRLVAHGGEPCFLPRVVAVNRDHPGTKTNNRRRDHYREAMAVVRRHHGRLPLTWWLKYPLSVWLRGAATQVRHRLPGELPRW